MEHNKPEWNQKDLSFIDEYSSDKSVMSESNQSSKQGISRWIYLLLIIGGLVAFAVVGYVGYRFILNAEQGVEKIGTNSSSDVADLPDLDLSADAASNTNVFVGNIDNPLMPDITSTTASSGADVQIQAGDLIDKNGMPLVRLQLENQGNFAVSSVYISLELYSSNANGQMSSVSEHAVGVPVKLSKVLDVGESRVVYLPITDAAWQNRSITEKRVLAKVLTVSDADRDNVDYPQISDAVLLHENAVTQTPAAVEVLDTEFSGSPEGEVDDETLPNDESLQSNNQEH